MEQTVIARNKTAEARAKFEMAERLAESGRSMNDIADVLQSDTVRLLKEKLAKATGREAELATRYGPRHPEMQKIPCRGGRRPAARSTTRCAGWWPTSKTSCRC